MNSFKNIHEIICRTMTWMMKVHTNLDKKNCRGTWNFTGISHWRLLQLLKRFKAHAWNHDWGILGQLPCNLARIPPKIFGLTLSLPSVSGWTTPGITLGISQSLGLSCLISRYSCWDLPRRSSRGGREGLGQPAGEKSSLLKLMIYGWWMIYSKGGEINIYI